MTYINRIYKINKIVFIKGILPRGIYTECNKWATYVTTYYYKVRWQFAIPQKAYDNILNDVISTSNADFRAITNSYNKYSWLLDQRVMLVERFETSGLHLVFFYFSEVGGSPHCSSVSFSNLTKSAKQ